MSELKKIKISPKVGLSNSFYKNGTQVTYSMLKRAFRGYQSLDTLSTKHKQQLKKILVNGGYINPRDFISIPLAKKSLKKRSTKKVSKKRSPKKLSKKRSPKKMSKKKLSKKMSKKRSLKKLSKKRSPKKMSKKLSKKRSKKMSVRKISHKTTDSREKKRQERPSPSTGASTQKIGTVMRGNDNNMYKVIKTSSGVRRWKKIA